MFFTSSSKEFEPKNCREIRYNLIIIVAKLSIYLKQLYLTLYLFSKLLIKTWDIIVQDIPVGLTSSQSGAMFFYHRVNPLQHHNITRFH